MGPTARLGNAALWAQQEALGFLAKAEARALLAPQARRGPRANVAPLAPPAKMGSQGPWGFGGLLELPVLLARKGTREKWAPQVTKEARAIRGMRALLDRQVYGALRDTRAPREQMGLRAGGDPRGSLGRKEMME